MLEVTCKPAFEVVHKYTKQLRYKSCGESLLKPPFKKKKKKGNISDNSDYNLFDVITLNNFVFNSMNYFQTMWFAMGTICAPNIF